MSNDIKDFAIATLGSHTALQILKGARDEGMKAIAICTKETRKPYDSYGVADEIIEIDSFENFFEIEKILMGKNAIVIPHGSFVSYLGPQKIKDSLKAMHYGSKGILIWESDRSMERVWLQDAGLNLPKIYKTPEEIDGRQS